MNCREGELAVVTSGEVSAGRIVRTIKLLRGNARWITSKEGVSLFIHDKFPSDAYWSIDGFVVYRFMINDIEVFHELPMCRDKRLRPIRDSDGDDETLQWAPVPEEIIA